MIFTLIFRTFVFNDFENCHPHYENQNSSTLLEDYKLHKINELNKIQKYCIC